MLDGIETGYEEEFDFPRREQGPEKVYVFASAPRSGSTYFSHLLWASGALGAPLEYLNFLPSGPYAHVSGDPPGQAALWRSLVHRRTSPNGLFGLKCFPTQMQELQQANPALFVEVMSTIFPRNRKAFMVRLRRRDELAHAISYARAALSGVWRKEQEALQGTKVAFSAEAVDRARELLANEEAAWDRVIGMAGADPLTVWYEDVLQDPDEVVGKVASYLGVTLDPCARVEVPHVRKQSEADPKLWAELYAASQA